MALVVSGTHSLVRVQSISFKQICLLQLRCRPETKVRNNCVCINQTWSMQRLRYRYGQRFLIVPTYFHHFDTLAEDRQEVEVVARVLHVPYAFLIAGPIFAKASLFDVVEKAIMLLRSHGPFAPPSSEWIIISTGGNRSDHEIARSPGHRKPAMILGWWTTGISDVERPSVWSIGKYPRFGTFTRPSGKNGSPPTGEC